MLIQHQSLCAMLDQCIPLDPPIQFGSLHSYNTRCPPKTLHSTLSFHQQFFCQKATSWSFQMIFFKIYLLFATIYMIIYYMVCNYVSLYCAVMFLNQARAWFTEIVLRKVCMCLYVCMFVCIFVCLSAPT